MKFPHLLLINIPRGSGGVKPPATSIGSGGVKPPALATNKTVANLAIAKGINGYGNLPIVVYTKQKKQRAAFSTARNTA